MAKINIETLRSNEFVLISPYVSIHKISNVVLQVSQYACGVTKHYVTEQRPHRLNYYEEKRRNRNMFSARITVKM